MQCIYYQCSSASFKSFGIMTFAIISAPSLRCWSSLARSLRCSSVNRRADSFFDLRIWSLLTNVCWRWRWHAYCSITKHQLIIQYIGPILYDPPYPQEMKLMVNRTTILHPFHLKPSPRSARQDRLFEITGQGPVHWWGGGVIEERGRDAFHGGMSRDSPQTILAISESRGGMEMMAFMILHMPMMRIICPCVVNDINYPCHDYGTHQLTSSK